MEEPASQSISPTPDASAAGLHEAEQRAPSLQLLRQAVQATIFTVRTQKDISDQKAPNPNDLGSLFDFLGPEKLGFSDAETSPTVSTCTPGTLSKAQLSDIDVPTEGPSPPSEQLPPLRYSARCRRQVQRTGDRLTVNRAGCPRSLQLRGMLPTLQGPATEATPAAPSSARSPRRLPATPRVGGQLPAAAPLPGQGSRSRSQPPPPQSNFTPAFLAGTAARPCQERHPLLTAMEQQEDFDVTTRRTGFETSALLSHRLGDHVWDDPRKGFWSTPAEWSKAPSGGSEDCVPPLKSRTRGGKVGNSVKRPPQSAADAQSSQDMQQLLRVMDPEGLGRLQPELLVALLFWQGLARRRGTAAVILQRAFGYGDISCTSLLQLSEYSEVQVRMVEGLRRLTQRESLEHLCEFMAEGDMMRPRRWFGTMKRDPTGSVNIGELVRWLAHMEIISDRQDLSRFLKHVDLGEAAGGPEDSGGVDHRNTNFRLEDFICLLCRCTVTWCLHTTIVMLSLPGEPSAPSAPAAAPVAAARAAGERCTDTEMGKRWAELARHISISFFVNHKFWGPEARQVAVSVTPLKAATIGQELSHGQWLALYQRVRAQGMAAILPDGEDAEDPCFLLGLASQGSAWASAPAQLS